MKTFTSVLIVLAILALFDAIAQEPPPPVSESKQSEPIIQRKTHDEDFAAFKTNAAAWRSITNKPPMPQEVHKYQVLAANAVQEKRFEDAADYYEQGLAIYPTWPDAQHDVALIDCELGNYGDAAYHMRCYVELVPNAPDAEAASDQAIVWAEKARIASKETSIGFVSVQGEVKTPNDNISCYQGTTVLKAIQAAGGFTDFANKKKVKLIQILSQSLGQTERRTVNCEKAMEDPELDLPIHPGDKIIVSRIAF